MTQCEYPPLTPKSILTPLVKGIATATGIALITFFTWLTTNIIQHEKDLTAIQVELVQHEDAYKREFLVIHDELKMVRTDIRDLQKNLTDLHTQCLEIQNILLGRRRNAS